MKYPKETLTKNNEVRVLEEKGSYTRYTYLDPHTGKPIKPGKYSLILESEGSIRHLFVIPLKGSRSMIVKDEIGSKKRKIWDKEKNKAVDI
ncbi:hypothetical protein KY366_04865 [Candidatus Woesearchaeota archaeon]|nr:hypothetical protein [Candidatus Woesearchaeota archaeon]